jgi:hypothetical protein
MIPQIWWGGRSGQIGLFLLEFVATTSCLESVEENFLPVDLVLVLFLFLLLLFYGFAIISCLRCC